MEENQHMIADESYYYGCDNLQLVAFPGMLTPIEPDINQEIMSTDNNYWSLQEDTLYKEATKMFGYGNWKLIANHVQTRNASQCQSYAHQKGQKVMPRLPSFSQVSSMASFHLPSSNETLRLPPASSMVPQVSVSQNNNSSSSFFTTMETLPETEKINEHIVCEDEITGDEMAKNMEWFLGKAAKSPERYKRIRNHILMCWRKNRPHYLTKTAGRKNLTDCGDVNAVGRIHSYLESIQAINVNCVAPVAKKRSIRKRSDEEGEEVYEGADDDKTDKDHKSNEKRDGKARPKRNARKRQGFYGDNHTGYDNNPFTLIPVGYYAQSKEAPFSVEIGSDVMLVMEFHAHLAYTEIIGLLGGRFLKDDEGQSKLKVEYVFPCRSTSTGTQCEMDPASEMAARDLFEQKGLDVVGWYHSHPTFEPQPSIRDIENQTSYQDLFRNETSGDEPFIGFIISPYFQEYANDRSQIQCLHISKKWNSTNQYRLPFACIQQVEYQTQINQDVLTIFNNLLQEYNDHENKIDMTLSFGGQPRLDKLISSLRVHLHMSPENNDNFLESVRNMVQQHFIQHTHTVIQPSDGIVKSLAV